MNVLRINKFHATDGVESIKIYKYIFIFTTKLFKLLNIIIVSFLITEAFSYLTIKIFKLERNNTASIKRFDAHTHYNHFPNTEHEFDGWKEHINEKVIWHFDSNGFVDTPIENNLLLNNSNLIKVVIFGGSSVFGVGASSTSTTIASYLQRELNNNSTNRNYRVYNAGVRGFFSYLEFIRYLNDVRMLSPDIIISLNGRNDIYMAAQGMLKKNFDSNYSEYLEDVINFKKIFASSKLNTFSKTFLENTNIVTLFDILFKNKFEFEFATKQDGLEKNDLILSIDNYLFIMHLFKYAVEKEGKTFLWFLQPTALYKKRLSDKEDFIIKKFAMNYLSKIPDYKENINFAYNYILQNETKVIDLSNIFENYNETLYIDDCHYNDLGNEIIAKKIADIIHSN